jgi:hypothetical protein
MRHILAAGALAFFRVLAGARRRAMPPAEPALCPLPTYARSFRFSRRANLLDSMTQMPQAF